MNSPAPLAPIEPAFAETAAFVDATLDALLPKPVGPEARLLEAMRHVTLSGGIRLRAFLVLQSGRLFGVDRRALGRVAAAVECLSAYVRTHRSREDAGAILAGDALLALSFGLICSPEAHGDPFVRCELLTRLAAASGHSGMLGGQMMEIALQAANPPLPEITRLARMKTAALFTFCCEAGAIMGKASSSARQALAAYGQELGLAYQITDDLLSPDGGKPNVVSVLGPERARAQAEALVHQAVHHLDLFDEKADLLRAAATFVIGRVA